MASFIIQGDNSDDLELTAKLAKKLGVNVSTLTEERAEDLALGNVMIAAKTGRSVSRGSVMKKLRA